MAASQRETGDGIGEVIFGFIFFEVLRVMLEFGVEWKWPRGIQARNVRLARLGNRGVEKPGKRALRITAPEPLSR